MLKVDLDAKKGSAKIAAVGSGLEILADVTFLIREIHKSMDQDDARAFKALMQKCIAADDSPVWEEEEKYRNQTDGVKSVRLVFPWMPE